MVCHCLRIISILSKSPFSSFVINLFFARETCMVSCCKSNPTNSKLFPSLQLTFLFQPFSSVDAWIRSLHPHWPDHLMLIPDIRMKSRGASMPNIQSSISQLSQHRDQHPGIAILVSVFTISSLTAITQDHFCVEYCWIQNKPFKCGVVFPLFF